MRSEDTRLEKHEIWELEEREILPENEAMTYSEVSVQIKSIYKK